MCVGAFSVIVKSDGSFAALLISIIQRPEPVHGERGGRVDDVQRQGQDGDRAGHAGEAD